MEHHILKDIINIFSQVGVTHHLSDVISRGRRCKHPALFIIKLCSDKKQKQNKQVLEDTLYRHLCSCHI